MALAAEYGPRAGDLWRWVDETADRPMGEILARLASLDPIEWDATRASLDTKDHGTLLRFAQRAAFAAVRRADRTRARDAVIALSLVAASAIVDERVVWTVAGFVCHALRRVGIERAEVDLLIAADPAVRQAFVHMLDADRGLAIDAGVREATTREGLVFLDTGDSPYDPQVDLVDMAYVVAELLEADRYHVESIAAAAKFMLYAFNDEGDHVDQRAADTAQRRAAVVRMEAIADGLPYQPLSAYLVEFPDQDSAALVAAAADRRDWPDEVQIAVADGPICAVLRMDFRMGDEPFTESVAGLERFRLGLLAAISLPQEPRPGQAGVGWAAGGR